MNWYHLYDLLESLEIPVTLAHPLRTRVIAEAKAKTHKVDSTILAHLLRTDFVPAAYIQPRDGALTVVWLGTEGDEFVMGHMGVWQKVKNIRRDPRVALSLLGRGKNAMGLPEYLVVYGHARVTEGGATELLQRLAQCTSGPASFFRPSPIAVDPVT